MCVDCYQTCASTSTQQQRLCEQRPSRRASFVELRQCNGDILHASVSTVDEEEAKDSGNQRAVPQFKRQRLKLHAHRTSTSWLVYLLIIILTLHHVLSMTPTPSRLTSRSCKRHSYETLLMHRTRQFDPGIESNARSRRNADRDFPTASANPKCYTLDEATIQSTCMKSITERTKAYRSIYFVLPNKEHSTTPICARPINLYDILLFRVAKLSANALDIRTALGDRRATKWLTNEARQCIDGNFDECKTCLRSVRRLESTISEDFTDFNSFVIETVNCEADVGPMFTSNSSCDECLTWYEKWLLATPSPKDPIKLWPLKPCREWCHYAEMACPFFNRFADDAYAGLPAFRCEDSHIETPRERCACIHPCDMDADPSFAPTTATTTAAYIKKALNCSKRDEEIRNMCAEAETTLVGRGREGTGQGRGIGSRVGSKTRTMLWLVLLLSSQIAVH